MFSSHEIAKDIVTRAAVVASQVLERGGSRSLAEREASALSERNLAKFKGIEFRDREVEVSIIYQARSIIVLKHLPWVKKFAIITTSGTYLY